MAYATRTKANPGDLATSADQNQAVDNEEALKAATQPVQLSFIFDGGGAALPANVQLGIPYTLPAMTITDWEMEEISPASDSVTTSDIKIAVQVCVDTYANYPPTNSDSLIGVTTDGTDYPLMNEVVKNTDTTSDWDSSTIAQGSFVQARLLGLPGSIAFTGTGLDDMSFGESNGYTGPSTDGPYRVQIQSTGTPDIIKWSSDGGSTFTSDVSITAAEISLENGITVKFGATTGHTANDRWDFTPVGIGGAKKIVFSLYGNRAV
jgi:hypothetical protein